MGRRKKMNYKKWYGLIAAVVVATGGYLETQHQKEPLSSENYATESVKTDEKVQYGSVNDEKPTESLATSVLTTDVKKQVKAQNIKYNGTGAFVVDQNETNLNTKVSSAPYVQLARLDQKGRPGTANAWLSKASRQYRNRQETGNNRTINPIGWQQLRINGRSQVLYNRGHSIGYALAGNIKEFDASEANPQNITTQTAWANQSSNGNDQNTGQNYYESLVRKALDSNKKVRYRVTPIYTGNNLVPSVNHIEAKSSDGTLKINVLIPNVQPGVAINYQTGVGKIY